MSLKIKTIISDEKGNEIEFFQSYDMELEGRSLEEIESLVFAAKNRMGLLAEQKILELNQAAHTKKKKN